MIRRAEEQRVVANENMRGGKGCVHISHLYEKDNDEFYGKGRLFAKITLQPGESIGYHVHEGESEGFYVACGRVAFNDNGTVSEAAAGDLLFTGAGEGHSVENIGDDVVELIALILYK
ncbi:MAG: cupin domain-containing protein [Clostridia bacterium]|nr:cupin domain-containing protein [Clostridia bacterium]